MKRLPMACLLVSLALAVWGQTPDAPRSPASPGADLSTPRATVQSFLTAMSDLEAGEEVRLQDALNCLFLEKLPANAGPRTAHRLYAILKQLVFAPEDIPDDPEGMGKRDLTVELGRGDVKLRFKLRKYDLSAGNPVPTYWRFHTESLTDEALKKYEATLAEATSTPDRGDDEVFETGLESPRAAFMTFLHGMNGTHGMTRADALRALDLSEVSAAVRGEVGPVRAQQLKSFLDRFRRVQETELPLEHEGDFVFLKKPFGRIVLALVEDEERGTKAWKFSKETLSEENVTSLYESNRAQALAQGVRARNETVSFGIRLRDWMVDNAPPFFSQRGLYLQNYQWIGLFIIVFAGMLLSRIATLLLSSIIRGYFRRAHYALNTKLVRDFLRPIRITLMAWVWFVALTFLLLPANVLDWLKSAALVVTAIGAAWTAFRLIDIVGSYLEERAAGTDSKFDDLLVPIITKSLKIFAILMAVLIVAHRNQEELGSILAGLGLGGLAFALAAKDVVANLFGSLTILLDRPFQIGDWVTVGNIDGSVESVGLRSTKIRTFYNSLITVPNSSITTQALDNMGARRYRRIKTMISVAYDTPPEKIEAFCEGIRQLIRDHPYTRKDYYHCYLNQFEASSLDILLYCFVETPDWSTELRERHRLLLDIVRLAKRLNIEFAFPTQTLYMRREDPPVHQGDSDPETAMRLGRREADAIVREFTGLGVVPPPVAFDIPREENRGDTANDTDGS